MDNVVLKQNILDELAFDPRVDAAEIGVIVDRGIVTLTGHVSTYAQLVDAEHVVWRVNGVKGIAQEMTVKLNHPDIPSDEDIARMIVDKLAWNIRLSEHELHVRVKEGWVTVTGEVEWQYQKTEVNELVKVLKGVLGVTNQVTIKAAVSVDDIKDRIESALVRSAEVEADKIKIDAHNGEVILEGRVDSWSERSAVTEAAWSVPGVTHVVDKLSV